MKKIIALLTSICIVVSSVSWVFAEERGQEILSQIKTRIPDTSPYDVFNMNEYDSGSSTSYYYNWYSQDKNIGMDITCNDEALITSFGVYDYENEENKVVLERVSYDEALEKAKVLAGALNPSVSDSVMVEKSEVSEGLRDNGFSFTLQRYENGIPVYGDSGYIRINLDCTKILSYSLNYTNGLSFEDVSGIIDKDAAKNAFNEKIGIEPQYIIKKDYKEKTISTNIVYRYSISNKFINAETGEIIEPKGVSYDRLGGSGGGMNEKAALETAAADGVAFTEAENKQFEKMADLKTKEQLQGIIKNCRYIDFESDFILRNYYTSYNEIEDKFTADFSFENKKQGTDYKFLYTTLDMKTGEILSFYQQGVESEKLSDENVKYIEEAVKALAGEKFGEYRLETKNENSVVYERYVNDIVCPSNTINIMLTGDNKIKSYNIRYTDTQFISKDGILTKADALQKLYEYDEFYLCYTADGDKFVPVYRFEEYCEFDAFTGERDNFDKKEIITYSDVSGHWAEDKINVLARYGVGFSGGEFKPEQQITQKEFAALLNSIYGNYISVYPKLDWDNVYSLIERRGVINEEEISPDELVSRETAAVFMVRAMGAEKYAKLENIYNCPFVDVTASKGYITLLYGFGMVSGTSENTFSPEDILTRAEAVVMLYNYLIAQ